MNRKAAELIRSRPARAILAAAFLAALAYLGRGYFSELDRLGEVPPLLVAAIFATFLLGRLTVAELLRAPLHHLGHSIRRYEAFHLTTLVAYANLFIPRAGMGAPALFLKQRHGVSYTEFSSLTLSVLVLQLTASATAGLLSQGLMWGGHAQPPHLGIGAIFAAVAVGGVLLRVARLPSLDAWQGRIGNVLRRLGELWTRQGRSAALTGHVLLAQGVGLLLRAFELQLAFLAIGVEAPLPALLLASALADLVGLISITPMGLGFREGAIVYAVSSVGISAELGLAAAILDRLVVTIGVLLLGQAATWHVLRPLESPEKKLDARGRG